MQSASIAPRNKGRDSAHGAVSELVGERPKIIYSLESPSQQEGRWSELLKETNE